jgi:hypothetical protein
MQVDAIRLRPTICAMHVDTIDIHVSCSGMCHEDGMLHVMRSRLQAYHDVLHERYHGLQISDLKLRFVENQMSAGTTALQLVNSACPWM